MSSKDFISQTLALAKKGQGKVAPNPMVGCVITKKGKIIGEGWHKKYGKDHAEVNAIKDCQAKYGKDKSKELLKDSCFFVNLEPCSIKNNTPACTDSIIRVQAAKVVCSMKDPNPRINGKGINKLRAAGIKVEVGSASDEAKELNKVFIVNQKFKRPFITIKYAQTLDQMIGYQAKRGIQISNARSKQDVQNIRKEHSSILIGANTLRLDNPRLTSRPESKIKIQPAKIIVGNNFGRLIQKNIFKNFSHIFFVTSEKLIVPEKYSNKVTCIQTNKRNGLQKLFKELMLRGYTSILVEGGKGIISSFIKKRYFDELIVYTAPRILGSKGLKAMDNKADKIIDTVTKVHSIENFGEDLKVTYINKKANGI
jgi:diaminohydroxyphosphoribosylaminopyrimidine deaminase/5-amino-6-(5-phosphoribosylamino)uracil reductase